MNIYKALIFLGVLFLSFSCVEKKESKSIAEVLIIPKPSKTTIHKGTFTWPTSIPLYADKSLEKASDLLLEIINPSGFSATEVPKEDAQILFETNRNLAKESYRLHIEQKQIVIEANDSQGAIYAVQSLRQLFPTSIEQLNSFPSPTMELPQLVIEDTPRFSYRGMHLDVSRHFHDIDFIKEYLEYLSLLKMNYFHWHLTDDQGWRIEIKKYPRLTTHAAFRDSTLIGHYNDSPQQYDAKRYGGFYTQEQIKEVVAYANQLGITIIPEIEMPGHAQAAISAYPELGCTGKAIPVAMKWGVFENIFCPNEKTFAFLEDVLTEVITLFPGEYIHIGGDEAPKIQWENSSYCQRLMQQEGLDSEAELQSYFIKRIERFLNSKGKKLMGWDEILEGGLAPNAAVMSWRGTEGGIEAARAGHPVIMTPTSHCYFDYYQSEQPEEPLAIGGFIPLKKVFAFNPIPKELNTNEAKFILGGQGNVWTEYMSSSKQVEYMIFPRILAMSEVLWTGPASDLETAYPNFVNRVAHFNDRLDAMGVHYANHLYALESEISKEQGQVFYGLKTELPDKEIRYRINASEELVYESAIAIDQDATITSQVFEEGKPVGRILTDSIFYHKAIAGTITLNVPPHPSYATGGTEALINGRKGNTTRYGDKEWLGFWGDDLEIDLEFSEPTSIAEIKLRFFHAPGQWIYTPEEVILEMKLEKGEIISDISESDIRNMIRPVNFKFAGGLEQSKVKSLKLWIPNYGTIPEGKQGAGHKAWTFIDEIIIN